MSKEKTLKAKNNYEAFWAKISTKEEHEEKKLLPCYKTLVNKEIVEDYYWSDHKITPTALLRWIQQHNNTTKKRSLWVTEIALHPETYDELITMYAPFEGLLNVEDVNILRNDTIKEAY